MKDNTEQTKVCIKCNEEKNLNEFQPTYKKVGQVRNTCKECLKIYFKEYYRKNIDKQKEKRKIYRESHREYHRKKSNEWYDNSENKERRRLYNENLGNSYPDKTEDKVFCKNCNKELTIYQIKMKRKFCSFDCAMTVRVGTKYKTLRIKIE